DELATYTVTGRPRCCRSSEKSMTSSCGRYPAFKVTNMFIPFIHKTSPTIGRDGHHCCQCITFLSVPSRGISSVSKGRIGLLAGIGRGKFPKFGCASCRKYGTMEEIHRKGGLPLKSR